MLSAVLSSTPLIKYNSERTIPALCEGQHEASPPLLPAAAGFGLSPKYKLSAAPKQDKLHFGIRHFFPYCKVNKTYKKPKLIYETLFSYQTGKFEGY